MQTAEASRDLIAANNKIFAGHFAAGDAAGIASLYTADGQIFPPSMSAMSGRAAIEAFWAGAIGMGITGIELTDLEVTDTGEELALECGTYRLLVADSAVDEGTYMVLWQLVDGAWYLHRDMWNSSREAAPA